MSGVGRKVRVHLLNDTDQPDNPLGTTHYLSAVQTPGASRLEALGRALNIYRQNPGGLDHDTLTTATLGTRTESPGVGENNGGVINTWISADTGSPAYSFDWMNRYGHNGRGLQQALFLTPPGGGTWNPTPGGTYSSGIDPAPQQLGNLGDGYSVRDLITGSPMIEYTVEDLGGGSKRITTVTIPCDFNPDGGQPEGVPVDKGGTPLHDPVIYPDIEMRSVTTVNWGGNNGIHRVDNYLTLPVPLAAGSQQAEG